MIQVDKKPKLLTVVVGMTLKAKQQSPHTHTVLWLDQSRPTRLRYMYISAAFGQAMYKVCSTSISYKLG